MPTETNVKGMRRAPAAVNPADVPQAGADGFMPTANSPRPDEYVSASRDANAEDIQTYLWDGSGPFSRREGLRRVTYVRGDKIDLNPYAAYKLRGSLKTLGGAQVPASRFDGRTHPNVLEAPARYPADREAEERRAAARATNDEARKQGKFVRAQSAGGVGALKVPHDVGDGANDAAYAAAAAGEDEVGANVGDGSINEDGDTGHGDTGLENAPESHGAANQASVDSDADVDAAGAVDGDAEQANDEMSDDEREAKRLYEEAIAARKKKAAATTGGRRSGGKAR